MPTTLDKIANPTQPTPGPGPKIYPIEDPESKKVEADALHMVKVLKRVKQLAPELWGIFRVK